MDAHMPPTKAHPQVVVVAPPLAPSIPPPIPPPVRPNASLAPRNLPVLHSPLPAPHDEEFFHVPPLVPWVSPQVGLPMTYASEGYAAPASPLPTPPSTPTPSHGSAGVPVGTSCTPSKNINKKKIVAQGGQTWRGSPKYTSSEIDILLDIVGEAQLLCANEWAVVAVRFIDGKEELDVNRDQDSLRKKFENLVAMKKKTGDPSCPPQVRHAKHIARDICRKASAGVMNDSSDCLLYTSPSPRDQRGSRMPSSA